MLSAVQTNGRIASGKNTPELLMIPVSAVGSSVATRFPEVSVRLPLHNDKWVIHSNADALVWTTHPVTTTCTRVPKVLLGIVKKSVGVKVPTKRVSNVGGVEPWGVWAAASWVADSAAKTV